MSLRFWIYSALAISIAAILLAFWLYWGAK